MKPTLTVAQCAGQFDLYANGNPFPERAHAYHHAATFLRENCIPTQVKRLKAQADDTGSITSVQLRILLKRAWRFPDRPKAGDEVEVDCEEAEARYQRWLRDWTKLDAEVKAALS